MKLKHTTAFAAALFLVAALLVNTTGFAQTTVAATSASSAIPTSYVLKGHWTKQKTDWDYTFTMYLAIDGNNKAQGVINWLVERVEPSVAKQFKGKRGTAAKEFVEGVYDPAKKVLVLNGTKKEDPSQIVNLDGYEISFTAPDGIHGKTKTMGTWEGIIFGNYTLMSPAPAAK